MIGLEIKVENAYGKYLHYIFHDLNLDEYKWDIIYSDFIYEGERNNNFFGRDSEISNERFNDLINRDSYYMIEATIAMFPASDEHKRIWNIKEYELSNCVLYFICYDCTNIEIYCKNQKILDSIYNNCKYHGFESIRYLN